MLLSHDAMEINHAPNPNDIIWENVSIPKSQVRMRNYITNIGLVVGSLFWSTLVTSVNEFSSHANLPQYQQQYLSVIIVLVFLLVLPFIFDFLARNYEGMKLESEIQNAIMTRYFYYQLINVYVTVGFGGSNIITQILLILRQPQTLVDILGRTIPSVSLYFVNLVIVKIFTAVPLEMMRPWQLSTILMMGTFMDRRKCTRRELRTGAFFAWPMLYGWVYPQLMMVTMIMVTYSCIAPLLMPFCVLFFAFAYLLYKYQLLYVYINDYQSGGEMWYAVFSRSLIALLFAAFTLLGYLSLELNQTYLAGPFYFLLPLPFSIVYFWHYCEAKFKLPSMNLSFGFAKELDHRNNERRVSGKPVPHDSFRKDLYRQPALTERGVYPEPYRRDGTYDHLRGDEDDVEGGVRSSSSPIRRAGRPERGSLSLNVHEELDQGEDNLRVMEAHFNEVVLPLAAEGPQPPPSPNMARGRGGGGRGGRGRGRGGRSGSRDGVDKSVTIDTDDMTENPIHTRARS